MLGAVAHPIAMENAVDDVKAMARWITTSNAAAGVALAIDRCARELWSG
jgi:hydroxymethylpyrimidine pyrophosphatase-like HAD family hydrolase